MDVLEFTHAKLESNVAKLCELVLSSGYRPDLIIGIATGGVYLKDIIKDKKIMDAKFAEVVCKRNSTGLKNKINLRAFLRCIPSKINDYLRIIEHYNRRLIGKKIGSRLLKIEPKYMKSISEAKSILIVDDAVDSGLTISKVIEELSKLISCDAQVRVAVITTTWEDPILTPDYSLYFNALIRFPWSCDASK